MALNVKEIVSVINTCDSLDDLANKKYSELGLLGLILSESYGGLGMTYSASFEALKSISAEANNFDLLFSVIAQLTTVCLPIQKYGSEDQKLKYLAPICHGYKIGCNLITEPNYGSDVLNIQSRLLATPTGYVLNAEKVFITNASFADVFVCYCKHEKQDRLSVVVFEDKYDGTIIRHALNSYFVNNTGWGNVSVRNLELNGNNVLARLNAGYPLFMESLNIERLLMSALHLGRWQRALHYCLLIDRQISRKQPNSQVFSNIITQSRISFLAASLLCEKGCTELDKNKRFSELPSMCKYYTSNGWRSLLQSILPYVSPQSQHFSILNRLHNEALLSTTYSGTNDILLKNLARRG